jgi:phasin family protein
MASNNQDKMINALQEQQAHWVTFASKLMEASMKLVDLNAKMAKESIDDTSNTIQQILKAKAPDEMLKVDAGKMQEKITRMMTYTKEMNAITSAFNAELYQTAQAQLHDSYEKASKLVSGAQPAASQQNQQPFDFMLSAFGDASKGYEQFLDAGKKLAEAVGKNVVIPTEKTSSKKRVHH